MCYSMNMVSFAKEVGNRMHYLQVNLFSRKSIMMGLFNFLNTIGMAFLLNAVPRTFSLPKN